VGLVPHEVERKMIKYFNMFRHYSGSGFPFGS